MTGSFEVFIAGRYLRAKRKQAFVSLITLISIAGVAIGVMALILVLGVIFIGLGALNAVLVACAIPFSMLISMILSEP